MTLCWNQARCVRYTKCLTEYWPPQLRLFSSKDSQERTHLLAAYWLTRYVVRISLLYGAYPEIEVQLPLFPYWGQHAYQDTDKVRNVQYLGEWGWTTYFGLSLSNEPVPTQMLDALYSFCPIELRSHNLLPTGSLYLHGFIQELQGLLSKCAASWRMNDWFILSRSDFPIKTLAIPDLGKTVVLAAIPKWSVIHIGQVMIAGGVCYFAETNAVGWA